MTIEYPCGICKNEVKQDDKYVHCDLCSNGITSNEKLQNDTKPWYCPNIQKNFPSLMWKTKPSTR